MIFIPTSIQPSMQDWIDIDGYEWPRDAKKIARLPLVGMQVWYAGQDPIKLIESDSDFHAFWYKNYVLPLKIKRFWYLFKFW